jgi:hypothetical protein
MFNSTIYIDLTPTFGEDNIERPLRLSLMLYSENGENIPLYLNIAQVIIRNENLSLEYSTNNFDSFISNRNNISLIMKGPIWDNQDRNHVYNVYIIIEYRNNEYLLQSNYIRIRILM